MSTRLSKRNLFPPLDNPELTIQRISRVDPTLLNDFEMASEGNGDLPVPDLRTMEELCQPSLNGRGGPIAPIAIQTTNFGLKNDMIQQVQNSCQFHGLLGDDANKHLDKFLHVTQSIKVNGVIDDALRLYIFPHSLTHHATTWFDRLPRNLINTFKQMAKMFLGKYFSPSMVTKLRNEITNFCQRPDKSLFEAWEHYKLSIDRCPNHNMLPVTQIDTFYNGLTLRHRDTINVAAGGTFMKRRPEECYELIKNMTAHHNDWDTSAQRSESSSSITSSSDTEIATLKAEMAEINKNLMRVLQANDVILKNMQTNMNSWTNSNLELKTMFGQFMKMNTASSSGSITLPGNIITNPKEELKGITTRNGTAYQGPTIPTTSSSLATVGQTQKVYAAGAYQGGTHPSNTITNPKEELKGITTRSGTAYQGPAIPTTSSSLPKVVERETEIETTVLNFEPVVALIIEPVDAPVSAPKPNQKPSIPYPSRLHDQKLRDKTNEQKEKFFKIFQDLNFNISFADALILMPKFSPSFKILLTNKDKLYELARTSLNEHCSAILLKKLPEKLGDLGKLSLPELSSTCMTLELANRLISRPVGVAKDVFVKVGKFHFPANFVVVDFDADPRVPLIHERSFLKTRKALINVFKGELTLRVGREAITFNLDQTSRYSANYNDMTENQIDVIDMASKTDKSSIDEPPEVELKDLSPHLEYAFLEGDDKLPVIIAKDLSDEEKTTFITVLKLHKRAIAWKLFDIKGIDPEFCTHKILMKDDFKPVVQHQRRVNPKIHDVIKKEVLKLLDARLIKPISDSPWVSPVHCVPKKGGFTVVENEENEFILTRLVTGWRVCIDYRKLNEATHKDHFPLPFMDQMLKRLAGSEYYCFLGLLSNSHRSKRSRKDHIHVSLRNGCLTPHAFWIMQCTGHVPKKSHFMVKEGIVLGHKISKNGIEVDKAKVDVIAKLPHPTTVKGIRSDRGTHFCNDQFAKVMLKYGVTQRLATPYHPQTSGQVEVSNRGLKRILKMTVDENHASWLDKLDGALWAFQTAYKTPIRCTPYKLVYGKACHLPIELEHKAYWALKHTNFDLQTVSDHRKVQLNELNELCDQAYENSLIYKEKTKRLHDFKIKDRIFNVGDRVLLFNSRMNIFLGKLKTCWSGPFTITHVFPYGTVELSQTDRPNLKVNGHRLKHYFGEDIPKMVVPDL
nr:reverse transcriptase domain-containing protein [Tanacetum cinerariifolium]